MRELEEDVRKKRIRGLFIVKSRGTGHDSDAHKLILSDNGIILMPMDSESTVVANEKKKIGNVSEGQKLTKQNKGE